MAKQGRELKVSGLLFWAVNSILGLFGSYLMDGWFGLLRFEFLGKAGNTCQVWVCQNWIEIAGNSLIRNKIHRKKKKAQPYSNQNYNPSRNHTIIEILLTHKIQ
jgi:hypothetical protein